MKIVAENYDQEFFSAGDFSLMVSGIPPDVKDAREIVQHFTDKLQAQVHSVLLCYDVRDYGPLQEELDNLVIGVCTVFFQSLTT